MVVGAGLSGVGAACRLSRECPDRSMLVVPDYWMQRNRAGRPQSWIAESTEARGDTATKVTRDIKRPGAEVNWDYAVVERLSCRLSRTHASILGGPRSGPMKIQCSTQV